MIQPQELRIGNLIERKLMSSEDGKNEWWKIEKIDINTLVWLHGNPNDSDYRAIPLTEEILLKFRYKKIRDNEFLFDNHFIIFIKESKIDFCLFNSEGNDFFVCEIQFAHELQNLHYSIRKEELTFK